MPVELEECNGEIRLKFTNDRGFVRFGGWMTEREADDLLRLLKAWRAEQNRQRVAATKE